MYMNDGNKTKINLRNKSVFITGVAGFIGSNLAKRLLSTVEGVKVVGLDNMNHYYDVRLKEARLNELEQFDNFSFVKGNLADKAVIESIFEQYKPEIVVNLGAQAGVRYSITNPDAYVEANLMSFCEEEGRITVFRKTLEALEWPSHYRFLYNRKMKQIAVQACGAEESGAHRVGKPDESNSDEIKCMALVRMIYGDSGWDKKMSYRLLGRAFPQQRLVSFKITDAMQIENGRVLTENVNLTSVGSRIISCP